MTDQAPERGTGTQSAGESARMMNDLCEAISRIRWARGTNKLDAAIFEAVRLQGIADAGGFAHMPESNVAAQPADGALREALDKIITKWDDGKNNYRGRAIILELRALAAQTATEGK